MEWFQAIVGALSGGLLTALGGIFYLKSRLKKEGAEVDSYKHQALLMSEPETKPRKNKMQNKI